MIVAVLGSVLGLMVLTSLGSARRRASAPVAILSGFFFPVAWVVWYVRDELAGTGT